MKTTTLILLLRYAAFLHLGLISAGLIMPAVVNLKTHVRTLPCFIRRLFWVYYTFIGLCLVCFGTMTFVFAGALAGGSPLARSVCGFLAVFWTLRWIAATFVFDVTPYLTSIPRRLGYHATNIAFAYLPVVYVLAAWKGGPP
jgi:hypothetical protein